MMLLYPFLACVLCAQGTLFVENKYLIVLRASIPMNVFKQMSEDCADEAKAAAAATGEDVSEDLLDPYTIRANFGGESAPKVLRAYATPEGVQRLQAKWGQWITDVEQATYVTLAQAGSPTSSLSCPDTEDGPFQAKRAVSASSHVPQSFRHNASWGADVDIYVVDTGVECSHEEFKGRCEVGLNSGTQEDDTDLNGHGTAVAGVAAGSTVGIARAAAIVSVKVLNRYGSGDTIDIVAGLEWAVGRAKKSGRRSVINLSLVIYNTPIIDEIVADAAASGIVVVNAAGNYNYDACVFNPSSTPHAITVGATYTRHDADGEAKDFRWEWSDFGSCVDIFAVGTHVRSSTINGGFHDGHNGTSFAAPAVAGAAAAYLGLNPAATPADTKSWLLDNAVAGAVMERREGDPDKMLHVPCDSAPSPVASYAPSMENCFETYYDDLQGGGTVRVPRENEQSIPDFLTCWRMSCPSASLYVTLDANALFYGHTYFLQEKPLTSAADVGKTWHFKERSAILRYVTADGREREFAHHVSMQVSYTCGTAAPPVAECSEQRDVVGQQIDFSQGYQAGASVCWKVSCPADSPNGLIFFKSFDLEQDWDQLSVGSAPLTGTTLPDPISFTSEVPLHFLSDDSVQAGGFHLFYTCSDDDSVPSE